MNFPYLNIAIVALCAVAAALVTRLVAQGFRRNHLVFTLIWMALFPVALVLAFIFIKPEVMVWRARTEAVTLIENEPLLSILSARHSEVESEVREVMTEAVRDGLSGDAARRAAFRRSLAYLMPYFETYLAVAEDASLPRYRSALFRIAGKLRSEPGAHCYWLLTGSPAADGSTLRAISESEVAELSQAMSLVVRSAINNPQEPMSEEESRAYAAELRRGLEIRLGEAWEGRLALLNRSAQSDAEREVVCELLLELSEEIRRLPHAYQAKALRALLLNL